MMASSYYVNLGAAFKQRQQPLSTPAAAPPAQVQMAVIQQFPAADATPADAVNTSELLKRTALPTNKPPVISAYCCKLMENEFCPSKQNNAQEPKAFQQNQPPTMPMAAPAQAAAVQQQTTPAQEGCNKLQAPPGVNTNTAMDEHTIRKAGYNPSKVLHFGPFSRVWTVTNQAGEEMIAKVEGRNEKKKTLGIEARVYQQCLAANMKGIPKLHQCAEVSGNRVMIMQKLGTDLSRIRRCLPDMRFSTVDALKIALKTFARIRNLHENGWLHRDIKPSNFVTGGPDEPEMIYLVDYGLARPICDRERPTGMCPVVGTATFMSVNVHNRAEYKTKDDLESWFFMTCLLFNGTLPWINERRDRIADQKLWYLNSGRSLLLHQMPKQFDDILALILRANSNSIDYNKIVALLRSANGQCAAHEQFDRPFVWQTDPSIIQRALQLGPEQ